MQYVQPAPPYRLEFDPRLMEDAVLLHISGHAQEAEFHQERERPDHISCELEFLEFLLRKQAYALEQGDESMGKETRRATRLFLKEHLGRFGRAFGAQMKKHDPEGFLGKTGDFTFEFLAVECRRLDLEPGLIQLPLRSTAEDEVPMACGGESDLVQLGH